MKPFQIRNALRERGLEQGGSRDDLEARLIKWRPGDPRTAEEPVSGIANPEATWASAEASVQIVAAWDAFASVGFDAAGRVQLSGGMGHMPHVGVVAQVYENWARLRDVAKTLAAASVSRGGLGCARGPQTYLEIRTRDLHYSTCD